MAAGQDKSIKLIWVKIERENQCCVFPGFAKEANA
jgi:hypothetical protein